MMREIVRLLVRCGVKARGAQIREYPTRRSASTYPRRARWRPAPGDSARIARGAVLRRARRVPLLRRQDAARQRGGGLLAHHRHNQPATTVDGRPARGASSGPRRAFIRPTRELAAAELTERETPVFPHYSLLDGHDRFSRLPDANARKFQPLHRESCDFPAPVQLFEELGVRNWFAALQPGDSGRSPNATASRRTPCSLPTFALKVVDRRAAGGRRVYDLAVNDLRAFVAGVCVHNCIGNSGPSTGDLGGVKTGGPSRRCSRATATSRAASTRKCA